MIIHIVSRKGLFLFKYQSILVHILFIDVNFWSVHQLKCQENYTSCQFFQNNYTLYQFFILVIYMHFFLIFFLYLPMINRLYTIVYSLFTIINQFYVVVSNFYIIINKAFIKRGYLC